MSWIHSLENDAGDGKVFAKLNTMHAISGLAAARSTVVIIYIGSAPYKSTLRDLQGK
jgi:hypothetical protein